MPRKKRESYEDITRKILMLREKMDAEKKRITTVMTSYLVVTPEDFLTLGEFHNIELRRVMTLLSQYLPVCIQQVLAEKAGQPVPTALLPLTVNLEVNGNEKNTDAG